MDIAEKLELWRRQSGMTIEALAKSAGVPKGTLTKILRGETKSPTLPVAWALARALGRSLAEFEDGPQPADTPSEEARRLARDYDRLDGHGQKAVRAVTAAELERTEAARAKERPSMKVIPLFGNSFAAGRGDPDFGNPWEDYAVAADSPADFALRLNGDSMEPYLPDGSIALAVKRAPRDGEVAALLLDGEFLCKQVCQDYAGNLYLFALNRARKDTDQTIARDSDRDVRCFGTVLMDRVPLPVD